MSFLLRQALNDAEATLAHAERERDNWELDSDTEGATDLYESMLDEVHGEFLGMSASRILKECDETAYRCGFNDWADSYLDGMRERDKRQTFSDFDELCDVVEEAESARDDAQEALDNAEET